MKLLLDTSTPVCYVTVIDAAGTQHQYSWQADRDLARGLLLFLRDTLAKHQASFRDITGLGFMKGPGSFTGLRIGATVCNTLASSLSVPIVGETGERWQQAALRRLADGRSDTIVLPEYGAAARITTPRK